MTKHNQTADAISLRILVVAPAWVGDMVMAQSLFIELKRRYPQYQLDVLAPAWSLPVLGRMPEVDEAFAMPIGHGKLGIKTRWRLAREQFLGRYQWSIVIPGSWKSALVPFFARIPKRTGYKGEQRYGLLNDIHHKHADNPLNVNQYVALVTAGKDVTQTATDFPRLRIDDDNQRSLLARFSLDSAKACIGLCPGAEFGPAKRWPAKHFAELAQQILANGDAVILFGSAKDRAIASEINQLCDNACHNLCGETTLPDVIDLMAYCRVVVSNDSGLMHIAAAVGSSLVALYGSSTSAFTPPLSQQATSMSLDLTCRPCFKRECPLQHLDCLNGIESAAVFKNVMALAAKA